jgi:hypothetical protein
VADHVPVDLTNQRQIDINRAVGMITQARTRQTDMGAEIEVLKEEVAVLRDELEKRDNPDEER